MAHSLPSPPQVLGVKHTFIHEECDEVIDDPRPRANSAPPLSGGHQRDGAAPVEASQTTQNVVAVLTTACQPPPCSEVAPNGLAAGSEPRQSPDTTTPPEQEGTGSEQQTLDALTSTQSALQQAMAMQAETFAKLEKGQAVSDGELKRLETS